MIEMQARRGERERVVINKKPDGNSEFIGDGRDVKCKLPFLVEANKINLS